MLSRKLLKHPYVTYRLDRTNNQVGHVCNVTCHEVTIIFRYVYNLIVT